MRTPQGGGSRAAIGYLLEKANDSGALGNFLLCVERNASFFNLVQRPTAHTPDTGSRALAMLAWGGGFGLGIAQELTAWKDWGFPCPPLRGSQLLHGPPHSIAPYPPGLV